MVISLMVLEKNEFENCHLQYSRSTLTEFAFPTALLTLKDWRGGGCFEPGFRFFANNFGSNKATQSKLSDFS